MSFERDTNVTKTILTIFTECQGLSAKREFLTGGFALIDPESDRLRYHKDPQRRAMIAKYAKSERRKAMDRARYQRTKLCKQ